MDNNALKYILIFLIGIIENVIGTNWILQATKHKAGLSSIMLFLEVVVSLSIVAWAIKGDDTFAIIAVYAVSCGIGNFISIKLDNRKKTNERTQPAPKSVRSRKAI
jgi:uncharacterized protein YebE (UPF0316 family)